MRRARGRNGWEARRGGMASGRCPSLRRHGERRSTPVTIAAVTERPETVKIVRTLGGYAVFVSPSSHPVAVFASGYDLLDWVANHIAGWEAGVAPRRRPAAEEVADEDDDDAGPPSHPA